MTRHGETTRSRDRPFRIAVYPAGVTRWANPYFRLSHAALAKHGIEVSDDVQIDRRWVESRAGEIDALHMHWPEYAWRGPAADASGRLTRAARTGRQLLYLRAVLRLARRVGMRRLWTVHNVVPHEHASRWDRYGYRIVARETDLMICHSRSALDAARTRYALRGHAIVMPHGESAAEYPAPQPRADVVSRLGLDPSLPVVCCLGRLRHYKGIELACAAVARLNGRVQLVVAGERHGDFDVAPIVEMARQCRGIVLLARNLSPQEFSDVLAASEAMLLPYRQITGSGALLSAFGAGRGVIASDLPYFREIVADEPAAGVLVAPRDPATWATMILEYLSVPADVRSAAATRLAERYSWDRCIEPLVAALRGCEQPERALAINPIHA